MCLFNVWNFENPTQGIEIADTFNLQQFNPTSRDSKNEDDLYAYGPSRTHGLVDPKQDDQPEKCMINADDYAWVSMVSI